MTKKTKADGYIKGSANSNGAYIEGGGSITHKPKKNTSVTIEGNVGKSIPYKGKGDKLQGSGTISISHEF